MFRAIYEGSQGNLLDPTNLIIPKISHVTRSVLNFTYYRFLFYATSDPQGRNVP